MSGRLIVVRHGHTALNKGSETSVDKIRGWTDVPLSPEGKEDAEKAAAELSGIEIDRVLCSDLERSVETAKVIAQHAGVKVTPNRAWRPWHLGCLSGKPSELAQPVIEHFAREMPGQKVPEGESFDTFKARLLTALVRLLARVKVSGETVVLVTHFRDLKLIQGWLAAGGEGSAVDLRVFFRDDIEPGAILAVAPAGQGWKGTLISKGIGE